MSLLKTWFKRVCYVLIGLGAAGGLFIVSVVLYVQVGHISAIGRTLDTGETSTTTYGIVLGASVKPDNTPSDALYDRIATAVDLYNSGTVQKLLMTGDDGKFHVNEVEIMKHTAIELGVPESDIEIDGQGYRTYESCKRAEQELHITRAVIVTQRFHLGRALYLCSHFGIEVSGATADRQSYQRITFFWLRDLAASFKAWWDVNIQAPEPPVDASQRD